MQAILQTHSGKMFDVLNPDPFAISIGDIAHALAHLCRFGGHTREFYSVANHSVLVSQTVPAEHALTALMHDATEAYCGDMIGPLKHALPAYADVEAGLWEAIAYKFKLPQELPDEVKAADVRVLATEKRDVLHISTIEWTCIPDDVKPLHDRIRPLSAAASRSAFLKEFHRLKEARDGKR